MLIEDLERYLASESSDPGVTKELTLLLEECRGRLDPYDHGFFQSLFFWGIRRHDILHAVESRWQELERRDEARARQTRSAETRRLKRERDLKAVDDAYGQLQNEFNDDPKAPDVAKRVKHLSLSRVRRLLPDVRKSRGKLRN